MIRKLTVIAAFTLLGLAGIMLPSFTSNNPGEGIYIDKLQEQKAFALLNKVRKDPNSYSGRFGFSLKGVAPRPDLILDDSLTAVAERRAMDMAFRGYFGHVDPDGYGINYYMNKADYFLPEEETKHKKQSDYDAIEGGAPSGEVAIKNIIIDYDHIGDEGMKLLLGVGDFNSKLTDVGVAYVHGTGSTKYKSYTCIVLGKRARPGPSHSSFQ